MRRYVLFFICITLLSCYSILADDNYRPDYPFSDDVFSELPPFPEDFWDISSLFVNQQISAWHLGDAYLQPELIPTWDYWSTEVYGDENYSRFGVYGASFFPSQFDIVNVDEGEVLNISFFIKADWGIRFLQGCSIYIPDVEGLDIELIEPKKEILLQPTYPRFLEGWIQKVWVQIKVLERDNYSFKIYEGVPSEYTNGVWKELYSNDYISLGTLTRLSITINLYAEEDKSAVAEDEGIHTLVWFSFCAVILLVFIAFLFRRYDATRKRNE